MTVVVAIDAGTTGVRAIAFGTDGLPVHRAHREFPQHFPRPGWVEHDVDEIATAVDAVCADLATALDAAGRRIAAIGITDQRETIVAWDRTTGRPLHRAIVWQDRRTSDLCERLERDGALDIVRSTTGLVLDPYFSGTKARWLLDHADVPRDGSAVLGTIDSWLIWRLTGGAVHVTDVSNASRTMLLDLHTGEWSAEMSEVLGVPASMLPRVVTSSGRVGTTTGDCPLGAGIPISGIAGDQQASLFGQACFAPGDAKSTYGTGAFVLMNVGVDCPPPVDGLLTTIAWQLDGTGPLTYAYEGSVFATGAAVQWLRDGLGVIERSDDVTALAQSVDTTDGVMIVPAFTGLGSPWWDPHARGTVLGITRGTTAAHLARATLESIALQTRDVIDAMTAGAHRPLSSLRADGGGATDLVLQLQADQLGVPVLRPVVEETTALGAAYLAGLAEGVWDSLDDVTRNWACGHTAEPSHDRSAAEATHARWLRAVERSRDWDR